MNKCWQWRNDEHDAHDKHENNDEKMMRMTKIIILMDHIRNMTIKNNNDDTWIWWNWWQWSKEWNCQDKHMHKIKKVVNCEKVFSKIMNMIKIMNVTTMMEIWNAESDELYKNEDNDDHERMNMMRMLKMEKMLTILTMMKRGEWGIIETDKQKHQNEKYNNDEHETDGNAWK